MWWQHGVAHDRLPPLSLQDLTKHIISLHGMERPGGTLGDLGSDPSNSASASALAAAAARAYPMQQRDFGMSYYVPMTPGTVAYYGHGGQPGFYATSGAPGMAMDRVMGGARQGHGVGTYPMALMPMGSIAAHPAYAAAASYGRMPLMAASTSSSSSSSLLSSAASTVTGSGGGGGHQTGMTMGGAGVPAMSSAEAAPMMDMLRSSSGNFNRGLWPASGGAILPPMLVHPSATGGWAPVTAGWHGLDRSMSAFFARDPGSPSGPANGGAHNMAGGHGGAAGIHASGPGGGGGSAAPSADGGNVGLADLAWRRSYSLESFDALQAAAGFLPRQSASISDLAATAAAIADGNSAGQLGWPGPTATAATSSATRNALGSASATGSSAGPSTAPAADTAGPLSVSGA